MSRAELTFALSVAAGGSLVTLVITLFLMWVYNQMGE